MPGWMLRLALVAALLAPAGDMPLPGPPTPGKRGVGTWYYDGVEQALDASGVSWYYTWGTGPGPIGASTAAFVPMIWGEQIVRPDLLADARAQPGDALLGFNEPDVAEQADLSVESALRLWPQLEATGRRLGSPAPADGAATPGGWLDRFMTGADERGLRVDFVAVHWYGTGSDPVEQVQQLRDYLSGVHERYGRPVWLTEYALADFTGGVAAARYPDPAAQAAFALASVRMLDSLPFVERYAWFALSDEGTAFRTGLNRVGPFYAAGQGR